MAKQRILNPNMFIPRMPNTYQASRGYAMPAEGAVVYGDMPALQALPVGIQNVANARMVNQQQQQAEAQRLAQMWRDNELEAADGQLWSNQLGAIEQKHIQEGQQLMQEGINPYESMDPRAVKYRRDRRNIEGLRAYRGSVEKDYISLMQEMRNNPDKYDPESIKALQDWIAQGNVEDYYRSGAQLPGLQARFDINDALKGFTAPVTRNVVTEGNRKIEEIAIDRPAAERAIIGRIMSSPGGMRQLERITGGLPVQDVLSAPDTLEANIAMYDALYEGDPQFRAALASQGINSQDDPRYRQVVENAAQRRVQAKQALNQQMDNWVSMSSSGLKLGRSETPDFQEARFNLAQQQAAEASESRRILNETRRAALNKALNQTGKYADRQKWISDIQKGESQAVRNLNAALQEVDGRAERKGDVTYIYIPFTEKVTNEFGETQEVKRTKRIMVGSDSGEAGRIRINDVLNNLKSVGQGKQLDVLGYEGQDPLGVLAEQEDDNNDPLGLFD